MNEEIERRFVKTRIDDTPCADEIRALGVTAGHVFTLRDRIDCSHWRHVSQWFLRPTPRRYVTLRPDKVIEAMKQQGLW